MELYLDTADLTAITRLSRILPLAGVTTNPSIVAASGRPLRELIRLCASCWVRKPDCLRKSWPPTPN